MSTVAKALAKKGSMASGRDADFRKCAGQRLGRVGSSPSPTSPTCPANAAGASNIVLAIAVAKT